MADQNRKVPSTVSLTQRQTDAVRRDAKAKGISFGEMIRRIMDEWLDRQPARQNPGRIV